MNAISFDTLRYVKRLQAGGFTLEQAEAHAEALSSAISENLATSEDLKALELALRSDVEKLELNLRAGIEKLGLELRAEIRDSQMTTIKWLVPLMLGQTAILAALVKLL
jgi:hypothetical protein